ncbi:MAG TPA: o-succinylbenzoate synthase [Candidatus Binatia bacterium]
MKISGVDVLRYELPLMEPVTLKGRQLEKRRGLLLGLSEASGRTGWGEIAPLAGFSRESFQQAGEQALKAAAILRTTDLPAHWAPLEFGLSFLPASKDWSPSVTFGIELALWNLWLQVHGDTTDRPGQGPSNTVLLNGLLTGDGARILRQAGFMVEAGYSAVKMKVGDKSMEEDIRLTLKVREAIGPRTGLRLDANRAWNLDQALEFARGVNGSAVEYIEEPLAKVSDLIKYTDACHLPVALDETLLEFPPEHWEGFPAVKAIVLKPTLLGGLHRTLALARRARRLGILPVVSSTFESGIGILGLARLAALACAGTPAGLDTYRWLASDVIRPRIETTDGRIDLNSLGATSYRINSSSLQVFADA